jgi:hypothetical protein
VSSLLLILTPTAYPTPQTGTGVTDKLSSDSAKAAVNKYRGLVGQVDVLTSKYVGKEPPAIDFADYKKKIRAQTTVDGKAASVVDVLEAAYKSFAPPAAQTATDVDVTSAASAASAEAAAALAATKADLADLEKRVAMMKSKRVGADTTVDDIYEAYPDIKKEVHDEIENHEWHKDIA